MIERAGWWLLSDAIASQLRTHDSIGEDLQCKRANAAEAGALEQDDCEVHHIMLTPVLPSITTALVLPPPLLLPQEVERPMGNLLYELEHSQLQGQALIAWAFDMAEFLALVTFRSIS